MIDPKELRKGTYLHRPYDNTIHKVSGFLRSHVWFEMEGKGDYFSEFYQLQVIPISEDWFKKVKTHMIDEEGTVYIPIPNTADCRYYIVNDHIVMCKSSWAPICSYDHINTIHLFQNLFFIKTGTELELQTEKK